jgi:hypothetical protein
MKCCDNKITEHGRPLRPRHHWPSRCRTERWTLHLHVRHQSPAQSLHWPRRKHRQPGGHAPARSPDTLGQDHRATDDCGTPAATGALDKERLTLDEVEGSVMSSCNKVRARSFANSPDRWRHLLDWLIAHRVRRVHACLESTGRYSLGIAGALNEAGHVVSIVNPAQIRDFARTSNKTDGVDASHIREYCE